MMSDAVAQLFADDLAIGQSFCGIERTVGDDQFSAFAGISGDSHPIHYDDAYAAKTRFGKRLAHGLLITSMTALGAAPISRQLEAAMVAFVAQNTRFIQPVFVGDTLTSQFKVASVKRKPGSQSALVGFDVTLVNGRGELVLEGHHSYLLLCKSAASHNAIADGTQRTVAGGSMPVYQPIVPRSDWPAGFTFSPAVRVGNLVFLSGTTATDDNGHIVGPGDIVAQTRRIFEKFALVLETVGGSLANIVETTDYVLSMTDYRKTANLRRELFKGPPWPAATGVVVSGLVRTDALIEIKGVAAL